MPLIRKHRIAKATGPEAIERLRALTDRMEPKMAKAFRDAIRDLEGSIPDNVLVDLVERGDIDSIVALLGNEAINTSFQSFAAQYSETVLAGAALAADLQPAVIGPSGRAVNFVFNATNPKLSDFAQQNAAKRIREVGEDVRQVARTVVQRGTVAGDNPIKTARAIRDSIGLTARQEQAVANYRRYLENLDRTALDRTLRDRRFDRTVERAIREGSPLSDAQIEKMAKRYREKFIKHRSEVIARTESTRAIQGAQQELMQSYIDDGLIEAQQVRRYWHHTQDERTRAEHRMIAGMNPNGVGMEESFQTPLGPLRYPGDPAGTAANVANCRCTQFTRVVSLELLEDA